jgi:hypothetical protein
MKLRYLLVASLVGGLVQFAWGYVVHQSGLFPAAEPHSFTDSTLVVETVRGQAPSNGIYVDGRGLFAAVGFERDLTPKFASLAVPIAIQLLIEIVVAFLLAWLLLRLPVWSAIGSGVLLASVAVAASVALLLSQSNWYFFPLKYQLANMADLVVGWFLLGIVLSAFRRKWMVTASE